MPWRVFSEIQTSQMIDRTQPSGDVVKCIPISWLDDNFAYLKNRIYIGSGSPVGVIYPEQDKAWYFDVDNGYILWIWEGSAWYQASVQQAVNADKVDGFHASITPAPNVIVPLDANGVLDLSATYVRSNVYTFRRVDLTNATSDYMLQVGEEAIINFTNATSVPLRIATSSGTLYNLYVYLTAPSFAQGSGAVTGPALLLPNNTSITNAFYYAGAVWDSNGGGAAIAGNTSAFVLIVNYYPANCCSVIYNEVRHKSLTSISVHAGRDTYNYARWQHVNSVWNDYSTQWTSLGTIVFPQTSSGYIIVRRLV